MSDTGGAEGFDDILIKILAEMDEETFARTLSRFNKIFDSMNKRVQESYNEQRKIRDRAWTQEDRGFDAHQRRLERAAETRKRRDTARLNAEARAQTAALDQAVTRTKQAEQRKTNAERDAQRERDQIKQRWNTKQATDEKKAAQNDVSDHRKRNNILLQILNNRLVKSRHAIRIADWRGLQDQKVAGAKEVSATREQERRLTHVQQAELARRNSQAAIAEQGAEQRRLARNQAFYKTMRTITERSFTALLRSGREHYARRRSAQETADREMVADDKAARDRITRNARAGFAEQEALTRRALVRQQGVIQGFQQRNAAVAAGGAGGGAIGSIMSVRNLLLGAGVALSARAIFGPIMDYQQTEIAFEGILGSAEKAQSMLNDLRDFAAVTPFTFAGISESAKKLLAVGYAAEDVIPMMTTLGNAAASLGVGEEAISGVVRALGQMKGKGKVSAEELNQISEQVPGFSAIGAVAEAMGVSVGEAFKQIEQGAVPAEFGIQAILDGMEELPGAAGAMQRQSETLRGRLSTLTDTMQNLVIDAMHPLIGAISDAVGLFTTFLELLFTGDGIFKIVRSGLLGIAIALGLMLAYQGVVLMFEGLQFALALIAANPVVALFLGLAAALAIVSRHVGPVADGIERIKELLTQGFNAIRFTQLTEMSDEVARAGLESWKAADGIAAIPLAIGAAAGVIVAKVGDIRAAFGTLFSGDVEGFLDQMKTIGSDLATSLAPFVRIISGWLQTAFGSALDWIQSGGIGDTADAVVAALSPPVTFLRDAISDAVSSAVEWIQGPMPGQIGDAVQGAFDTVKANVGDFFTGLFTGKGKGGGRDVGASINTFVMTTIWPALQGIGATISDLVGRVDWGAVGVSILEALRRVGEFVGGPLVQTLLSKPVLTAVLAIAGALLAGIGALALGLVQGLGQSIPKVWDNLVELIEDYGLDALRGLAEGTMFEGITDSLLDALEQVFKNVGDELDFIGALINAITGNGDWSEVTDALGVLIGDAFASLATAGGLVRNIADSLNQVITSALANLSTFVTEWSRSLDGPLGGLARIIAAPFAGMFGIVSDVLNRVRDFVTGWIDVIVGIFTGDWGRVLDGARAVWGSLFGIIWDVLGRIRTAVWSVFTGIGQLIWGAAVSGFHFVTTKLMDWGGRILTFFESIPGRIADAFIGMGATIIEGIKSGFGSAAGFAGDLVGAVKDFINTSIIDKINDVSVDFNPPGPGSFHFSPDIPHLAAGGIVTKPTVALIGEAGPEAVVPLSDGGASLLVSPVLDAAATAASAEAFRIWVGTLSAMLDQLALKFEVTGTGILAGVTTFTDGVVSRFSSMLTRMQALAVTGGHSVVNSLKQVLNAGKLEVLHIVRGYARNLADSLNPLLSAIGEDPVTLSFNETGNINTPRIAAPSDGPQVHVFNEGAAARHGEAYIPFNPKNRSRSRAIAAETVARLGGRAQFFETGGITAQVAPGQPTPGVTGDVVGLVNEFANRLGTWAMAMGRTYNVGSGYRSFEEQARLYQRYLAGVPGQAPAAPPGSSMHNFGLASDGDRWGNLDPAAFGLTYPMSYEPWHVEPVEGKGLLNGELGQFAGINPIAKPPESAGERGELSRLAGAWMEYVYQKVLAGAGSFQGSMGMPSLGTAGAPADVMAAIQRAMGIVGVPQSWLGPLLTLISRESSFNPRAYNGILGASGLMQTIPSTFAAYALPGYGGIFDPLANVIAGLRYILERYGSIFNVQQANANLPPKGYKLGGVVDRDGMYRLGEGNRPEVIIPLTNTNRAIALMRATGLDALIGAGLYGTGGASVGVSRGEVTNAAAGPRGFGGDAPLVGVLNVNSNASDPDVVAQKALAKVNAAVRGVRV